MHRAAARKAHGREYCCRSFARLGPGLQRHLAVLNVQVAVLVRPSHLHIFSGDSGVFESCCQRGSMISRGRVVRFDCCLKLNLDRSRTRIDWRRRLLQVVGRRLYGHPPCSRGTGIITGHADWYTLDVGGSADGLSVSVACSSAALTSILQSCREYIGPWWSTTFRSAVVVVHDVCLARLLWCAGRLAFGRAGASVCCWQKLCNKINKIKNTQLPSIRTGGSSLNHLVDCVQQL